MNSCHIAGGQEMTVERMPIETVELWNGVGGNGEMPVKGYKPSVLRWVSSEDVMYSVVTIANDMVLCTWNLLIKE